MKQMHNKRIKIPRNDLRNTVLNVSAARLFPLKSTHSGAKCHILDKEVQQTS